MEGLLYFVSIIIIVFGILQIILFFKLWGMTDDIRVMKNKYLGIPLNQPYNEANNLPKSTKILAGVVVENIKTGKKMTVKGIKNGKYTCSYADGYNVSYADFEKSEIRIVNP